MPRESISIDEMAVLRNYIEEQKTIYTVLTHSTGLKKHLKVFTVYQGSIFNITGSMSKLLGGKLKDGSVVVSYPGEDAGAMFVINAVTRLYNDFEKYKEFSHQWL